MDRTRVSLQPAEQRLGIAAEFPARRPSSPLQSQPKCRRGRTILGAVPGVRADGFRIAAGSPAGELASRDLQTSVYNGVD
jgi:hypothetical protein